MPTIPIFQDTVATSSTGAILATSLKALLTRRPDLRCTLKGSFDGMTDAIEPKNQPIGAAWVIGTILEGSSRTRRTYVTRRHGAEVISLGNAAYDVLITDAEYQRRCELLAGLPTISPPDGEIPRTWRPGIVVYFNRDPRSGAGPQQSLTLATLLGDRTRHLDSITDPLAFDEEVEALRALSTPDALAAFLHTRGVIRIVDFGR